MAGSVEEAVGGRIRELRKAAGLTQAALAERAGISFEAMSRIERGRASARVGTLARVAHALSVGLPELVSAAPLDIGVGRWLLVDEVEAAVVRALARRPARKQLALRVVETLVASDE